MIVSLPLIDTGTWRRNGWLNTLHTALLLVFMAGYLALLGWLLWGIAGLALLVGVLILPFGIILPPAVVMRRFDGVLISFEQAPWLFSMVTELSARAGLLDPPALYYVPNSVANAFTVGNRRQVAVALTDGLLRGLDKRELAGVLAHEIGHIHSGDIRVMALADVMSRAITLCAQIGLLLVLIGLPLMLMGDMVINPLLVMLLILAPYPAALAQLALSRIREYDADRFAISLTGDPDALADALEKLEDTRESWLSHILLPGYRREPALLRSHPSSARRIARLKQFSEGADYPMRESFKAGGTVDDIDAGHLSSRRSKGWGRFRF